MSSLAMGVLIAGTIPVFRTISRVSMKSYHHAYSPSCSSTYHDYLWTSFEHLQALAPRFVIGMPCGLMRHMQHVTRDLMKAILIRFPYRILKKTPLSIEKPQASYRLIHWMSRSSALRKAEESGWKISRHCEKGSYNMIEEPGYKAIKRV